MAFSILYTILDEKAAASTMKVNLPSATAFADVILFVSEFADLVDAVINGQIIRAGVAFEIDIGTFAAAAAGSDVEEGARFNYRTDGGFLSAFRIPTFLESLIVPGTRQVDTADLDVLALDVAVRNGIDLTGVGGSGVIAPSDQRDEDIVSLTSATESFTTSRRV